MAQSSLSKFSERLTYKAIKSLLIKYSEENEIKFKSLEDSLQEFKKENETRSLFKLVYQT